MALWVVRARHLGAVGYVERNSKTDQNEIVMDFIIYFACMILGFAVIFVVASAILILIARLMYKKNM